MVYLIGLAAAVFLGAGWVVQQRIATQSKADGTLSWTVLGELATSWLWWSGIAAMTIGQSLAAWALQFGPVSAVEPVLVVSLLIALVISAIAAHHRPRWPEFVGPLVLCTALIVFLAVSDPRVNRHNDPGLGPIVISTATAAGVVAVIGIAGLVTRQRASPVVKSALLAVAAGVMYGLQDATTRGALAALEHRSWFALLFTMWPWVVLGSATAGVLLSQAAFRAERLDYALPPTVAAQPIAGIVLGVTLLGDRLTATGMALAFEATCLVAMLVGVVLVGLSPALE